MRQRSIRSHVGAVPRGFTLIEVLVVVAIIALLIAILLPSLKRARSQARSAACLANLKNLGASMMTYRGAYNGWLPVGPADRLLYKNKATGEVTDKPGPNLRPYPAFTCAWGGKRAAYPHDFANPPKPETLKRPLTDYIYHGTGLDSPAPLFECPDDRGVDKEFQYWIPDNLKTESMYNVCGNSYYNNPWDDNKQVSTKRLKMTSNLVLAEEAPMLFSMEAEKPIMGWHGRFGRHNILFLDFHAADMNINPTTKGFSDPHRYEGPGWFAVNYFEIMDYYK